MQRVAIVDDSADIRAVWRLALQAGGAFEVCGEASDGREAVALARSLRPDVILLDLSMPDMGGLEALPLICSASPGTRVVVLSAFGKRRYAQQAADAGAVGFLEKHHPADTLSKRLQQLLEGADGDPDAGHATFGPY